MNNSHEHDAYEIHGVATQDDVKSLSAYVQGLRDGFDRSAPTSSACWKG